jgi:hypothetical protein
MKELEYKSKKKIILDKKESIEKMIYSNKVINNYEPFLIQINHLDTELRNLDAEYSIYGDCKPSDETIDKTNKKAMAIIGSNNIEIRPPQSLWDSKIIENVKPRKRTIEECPVFPKPKTQSKSSSSQLTV